jgi:undecaprenyl-diphosphatase
MINQLAGKNFRLDKTMIFASNKIRYIFAFVLFIIWLRGRSTKKVVYQSGISIMINICINFLFKQLKYRPRPFMIHHANVLLPTKQDSTYLSKHTILAFSISTSIYMYNKIIGYIMYGLSILTGFSRIWVGAHYPYDVIRSAFIGSVVSVVVNKISFMR